MGQIKNKYHHIHQVKRVYGLISHRIGYFLIILMFLSLTTAPINAFPFHNDFLFHERNTMSHELFIATQSRGFSSTSLSKSMSNKSRPIAAESSPAISLTAFSEFPTIATLPINYTIFTFNGSVTLPYIQNNRSNAEENRSYYGVKVTLGPLGKNATIHFHAAVFSNSTAAVNLTWAYESLVDRKNNNAVLSLQKTPLAVVFPNQTYSTTNLTLQSQGAPLRDELANETLLYGWLLMELENTTENAYAYVEYTVTIVDAGIFLVTDPDEFYRYYPEIEADSNEMSAKLPYKDFLINDINGYHPYITGLKTDFLSIGAAMYRSFLGTCVYLCYIHSREMVQCNAEKPVYISDTPFHAH